MSIGQEHRPLRMIVCDEIRRRILDGEYPAGSRLVEERIAAELGVSRNPVREALRILEAEVFVEIIPRRGAVVANLGLEQPEELYELLVHLECLAARLAARKAQPEDGQRLLDIAVSTEVAAARRDYVLLAELNSEFHTAVLDVARNAQLETVLVQIRNRNRGLAHIGPAAVARLSLVFAQDGGVRGLEAAREHQELAKAIIDGDQERAAELTERHIDESRAQYAAFADKEIRTVDRRPSSDLVS